MQIFTFFSLSDLTFSFTAQTRFELGAIWKQIYHRDELPFVKYNIGYCGVSSSPDHRVESLIEFLKVVLSFNGDVMVIAHWFAAYDFDVAIDKFDFAPVQSPDMRSSRCKKTAGCVLKQRTDYLGNPLQGLPSSSSS